MSKTYRRPRRFGPRPARRCNLCGDPLPTAAPAHVFECDPCSEWLNSTCGEDFHEPDYGGAFDGFTVTSDADPGL